MVGRRPVELTAQGLSYERLTKGQIFDFCDKIVYWIQARNKKMERRYCSKAFTYNPSSMTTA